MKDYDTFKHLPCPVLVKTSECQEQEGPLYARITVNGKRSELSLKRKVPISDWDTSKNRLKGTSESNKLVNAYICKVTALSFNNMVFNLLASGFLSKNIRSQTSNLNYLYTLSTNLFKTLFDYIS